MGVKNLTKLLKQYDIKINTLKLNDLKDKCIAVDMSWKLYSSHIITNQTDDIMGSLIKIFFGFITNLLISRIIPICVYDNRLPQLLKDEELKKREKVKGKLDDEYNKLDIIKDKTDEDYKRMDDIKQRLFVKTNIVDIIDISKKILDKLGVEYYTSPSGIDAEHMCATLYKQKKIIAVISADSDCLPFGAPMLRNIPKKTNEYNVFIPLLINKTLGITHDQFIKLCVALGCDYAPKVKGIGIKTVLDKIKTDSIIFNDEQKKAIALFSSDVDIDTAIYSKSIQNHDELVKFLSLKNISHEYITNKLSRISI